MSDPVQDAKVQFNLLSARQQTEFMRWILDHAEFDVESTASNKGAGDGWVDVEVSTEIIWRDTVILTVTSIDTVGIPY